MHKNYIFNGTIIEDWKKTKE